MDEFQIGDIVYLKGGTLKMTVIEITDDKCIVAWHDKNGKEHSSKYSFKALTTNDPDNVPPPENP